MGIISFLVFILNIIGIVLLDILAFSMGTAYGVSAIIGTVVFFIAYTVSVEVTIAPRDFWANSSFGVMMKKLSFAWYWAIGIGGLSVFVTVLIFGLGVLA